MKNGWLGRRATQSAAAQRDTPLETGTTFPADDVLWGIAIRRGFDELDDPSYHRGVTQHAYLETGGTVAICGFRPPLSGPRRRRRARLGLPTDGVNPMCGMCARKVVAPRPRAPVPILPERDAVVVPVYVGSSAGRPGLNGVGMGPRTTVPMAPRMLAPVAGPRPVGPSAQSAVANAPLPPLRYPPTPLQASAMLLAPGIGNDPLPPGIGSAPWMRGVGRGGPHPRGASSDGLIARGVHAELPD